MASRLGVVLLVSKSTGEFPYLLETKQDKGRLKSYQLKIVFFAIFFADLLALPRSGRPGYTGTQPSLNGKTMIVVHHLNNSRSQRVLWLLEELGLEYEVKRYQRDPKTMLAPASLKAVHPLGKSPVITDGANTIAESGAIIEYLVERYGNGRLIPAAGTPDKLRWTYWLHFAEGSAMPPLLMKLVFDKVESSPMPFFVKPIARGIASKVKSSFIMPNINSQLAYMEAELESSKWFAGNEFTAADIQMSFPLEAAAMRGGLDERLPKLTAFLQRIHARPAYQRALERGGPYDFAK
jgi:glutathione S-transferase